MKQLTPTQVTVVQALALGATVTAAAKLASVSRPTIYKWKSDPVFNQAVAYAKQEYAITMHDRMQALTAKAIDKLEEVLDNPKSSPSVILKAALAILNRQNWAIPAEDFKDIARQIHAAADEMEAHPEIMAEEAAYEKQLTDLYENLNHPTTVKGWTIIKDKVA
ncbi:MAG: hypothetical protein U0R19_11695 [Bryobacteraceae bacterium]